MITIGITGTLGAGKGAVVEYLKGTYGFSHYSARAFIVEEIQRRGLPVDRDSMTLVGNALRSEHHAGYIIEELYNQAVSSGQNVIIESIRTKGEIETLKGKVKDIHFYLLAVDADQYTRYERIKLRKSTTDSISFEKFIHDEDREMISDDPTKQNLRYCIDHADYVFQNDGTLEELYKQVDAVMKEIMK